MLHYFIEGSLDKTIYSLLPEWIDKMACAGPKYCIRKHVFLVSRTVDAQNFKKGPTFVTFDQLIRLLRKAFLKLEKTKKLTACMCSRYAHIYIVNIL